jgi:hypothetical protein
MSTGIYRFERYVSIGRQLVHLINDAHAAFAQYAHDSVSIIDDLAWLVLLYARTHASGWLNIAKTN